MRETSMRCAPDFLRSPSGSTTPSMPGRLGTTWMRASRVSLAAGLEERAQQLAGLFGEHAGNQRRLVVESWILHEVPERSREARLRIGRTEHDTIDAGEHDRSGAHRT